MARINTTTIAAISSGRKKEGEERGEKTKKDRREFRYLRGRHEVCCSITVKAFG